MYTIGDAAKLLDVAKADLAVWVKAGDRLAGGRGDPVLFGWIRATTRADGARLISEQEVARVEALLARPVTRADILAAGHAGDWLSVDDAARTLRVSARYVRRLCASHQPADGPSRGRRAMLTCHRERPGGPFLIRHQDLAAFAAHRRPPVARVGFDVTLTVEKSIAILTLLTTGERQAAFLRALRIANHTAINYLDRHAAVTRVQHDIVPTTGLVVAAYLHATSRTLDPHPHVHNIVANAVTTLDGQHRTLDARALYRHCPGAAALATAAARWELRTLGVGWRERDDGIWGIDGVTDAAVVEFSRRHHDIDSIKTALAERLSVAATDIDTTVWAQTRPDKHAVDPTALLADWRQRAARVGLDRAGLNACFTRTCRPLIYERLPDHQDDTLAAHLVGPHGVTSEESMFTRGDVLRAIADWAVPTRGGERRKVLLRPGEIERLTDRFLAGPDVVELHLNPRSRRGQAAVDDRVYATVAILRLQADIIDRYDTGQRAGRVIVPDTILDDALMAHDRLTGEQRELVTAWCTSGDTIQTAVGRAGTGKTTTMRTAVAAWQAGGYRVVGAAVKGEAARQLAHDAGIDADTVALLLTRLRRGDHHLDTRTVVIIDEASTIGDRDLHELLVAADRAGAAIRLIGDPAQHSAVPAGGSYRALLNHNPARVPQLTRVFRLQKSAERDAAELIRTGRVNEALDHLHTTGQLQIEPDESATYAAMIERWYTLRRQGHGHPMVHQRNHPAPPQHHRPTSPHPRPHHQPRVLGHARHRATVLRRRPSHQPHRQPSTPPRKSSRTLAPQRHPRHHHRHLPGRDAGRRHDDTRHRPRHDHRRTTALRPTEWRARPRLRRHEQRDPRHHPAGIDLDDHPSSDRAETYVDITRGQHSNQLYATITPSGDTTEPHLPRLPDNLDKQLQDVLQRTPHPTAHHADPNALQRARSDPTRTR